MDQSSKGMKKELLLLGDEVKGVGEEFGLAEDGVDGFLLFVGGIAIFGKGAFYKHHQLCSCAFPDCPIDGCVSFNFVCYFTCNDF
jgi:hypothetical protein